MFKIVLNTTRGKWSVALIIVALLGAVSSLKGGAVDSQAILGSVELIIISAILFFSTVKTINTPAQTLWSKWSDVPMNDAQLQRLARGVECGFTPKKVCIDAKYAIIVGSERKSYKTTLTRCSCPDFKKRKLPCKHMYFLAIQTDAIDKNTLSLLDITEDSPL